MLVRTLSMALRSALFYGLAGTVVLVDAQTTTVASKVDAAQCLGSTLATTIASPGDATALGQACPTYAGTVTVDPQSSQDLTFSGLQTLGGNLVIKELANSINIYFPDLTNIVGNGNLWLTGTQPVYVSFQSLAVIGNLYMKDWGSSTGINGEHTISTLLSAGSLQVRNITWLLNTGLTSVKLPSSASLAASVDITNNSYLSSVALAGSFSGTIDIYNNGQLKKADTLSLDLSSQLAELQPENERRELPATIDPRELEATSPKKAGPVSIYELPVKAG
ncbi:hypothetical protein AMS68_004226 [Peltaster fructicola]|uniref:Receptor L-domain domain-containing protein n=1 Tax=Peltaster fructicola TaxID=286661 RepID=A0A6H0XVR5_9PEZI|nr:hypothetical protein AMS68_004226 [Peltaster fructicola]